MRTRLSAFLAILLSGCAYPDPFAAVHALSQQQAAAMIGREYILVAPLLVCREPSRVYNGAIYGNLVNPGCRMVSAGRFRVEDAVALRNDGRTVLRITGPEIAGFAAYRADLPRPYKDPQEYFATGNR